jgi:hypothetical protein
MLGLGVGVGVVLLQPTGVALPREAHARLQLRRQRGQSWAATLPLCRSAHARQLAALRKGQGMKGRTARKEATAVQLTVEGGAGGSDTCCDQSTGLWAGGSRGARPAHTPPAHTDSHSFLSL